ncbi:hypothetical protein DFH27DRAFT_599882 [Peziza echinospora]|nr:hypothetical protein DFH27DRAFT_599882 [Peziza echinospora]
MTENTPTTKPHDPDSSSKPSQLSPRLAKLFCPQISPIYMPNPNSYPHPKHRNTIRVLRDENRGRIQQRNPGNGQRKTQHPPGPCGEFCDTLDGRDGGGGGNSGRKVMVSFETVFSGPLVKVYVRPKIERRRWGSLGIERLAERQIARVRRRGMRGAGEVRTKKLNSEVVASKKIVEKEVKAKGVEAGEVEVEVQVEVPADEGNGNVGEEVEKLESETAQYEVPEFACAKDDEKKDCSLGGDILGTKNLKLSPCEELFGGSWAPSASFIQACQKVGAVLLQQLAEESSEEEEDEELDLLNFDEEPLINISPKRDTPSASGNQMSLFDDIPEGNGFVPVGSNGAETSAFDQTESQISLFDDFSKCSVDETLVPTQSNGIDTLDLMFDYSAFETQPEISASVEPAQQKQKEGNSQDLDIWSLSVPTMAVVHDDTQEPIQTVVDDTMQEPTQAAVHDTTEKPTQATVQDTIQEPAQAIVRDSIQEPTQITVHDTTQEPTQAVDLDTLLDDKTNTGEYEPLLAETTPQDTTIQDSIFNNIENVDVFHSTSSFCGEYTTAHTLLDENCLLIAHEEQENKVEEVGSEPLSLVPDIPYDVTVSLMDSEDMFGLGGVLLVQEIVGEGIVGAEGGDVMEREKEMGTLIEIGVEKKDGEVEVELVNSGDMDGFGEAYPVQEMMETGVEEAEVESKFEEEKQLRAQVDTDVEEKEAGEGIETLALVSKVPDDGTAPLVDLGGLDGCDEAAPEDETVDKKEEEAEGGIEMDEEEQIKAIQLAASPVEEMVNDKAEEVERKNEMKETRKEIQVGLEMEMELAKDDREVKEKTKEEDDDIVNLLGMFTALKVSKGLFSSRGVTV